MQINREMKGSITVSELNRSAKSLLEKHFEWVWVEGEIGTLTTARSGHWYFTLKDEAAQVRCAMFQGSNKKVKVRPAQGDSIRIRARVSLYEGRGEFQLICEHLELSGVGALQVAFERLKVKLAREGIFETEHKRQVPIGAERIAIITSESGAALQDILSILGRRSPQTEIYLFPVPVQGYDASTQIADAIEKANILSKLGQFAFDAMIIGRGGGSLEDLWAFNEEVVARAIFASTIPTISAVGHEIDFSISDLVADLRAATPSAAAELVSTDQRDLFQQIDQWTSAMNLSLRRQTADYQHQLRHMQGRLRNPERALLSQKKKLTRLTSTLQNLIGRHTCASRKDCNTLLARLLAKNPKNILVQNKANIRRLCRQLHTNTGRIFDSTRERLQHRQRLLESLGPNQILNRGYAIVSTANGKILRESTDVTLGTRLSVRLKQGLLLVKVTNQKET